MVLPNPITPIQNPSEFIPGQLFEIWGKKWIRGKNDLNWYELQAIVRWEGEMICNNFQSTQHNEGFDSLPENIIALKFPILFWNPAYKQSLEQNPSISGSVDDIWKYVIPGKLFPNLDVFQTVRKTDWQLCEKEMTITENGKVFFSPKEDLPLFIGQDLDKYAREMLFRRLAE